MNQRVVSLQGVLLALVATASLAGLLAAAVVLDRWLAREIEARVRADLRRAPELLRDRDAAVSDAMMMHARDVAKAPGLAEAVIAGRMEDAVGLAEGVARSFNSFPVVVTAEGGPVVGPPLPEPMLAATRDGEMPVVVVSRGDSLFLLSVSPIEADGVWAGAGGVAQVIDEASAAALAGLASADIVVISTPDGTHAVAPLEHPAAAALVETGSRATSDLVAELEVRNRRFLLSTAPMHGATVVFARDLEEDLAIVGRLRRALATIGFGALGLALLLGAVLARGVTRPTRVLAAAAARLSEGDFTAPITSPAIRELAQVTEAFGRMRSALAVRIEELRMTNRLLEDRQERLTMLQAELIHRERIATSGRIAAELAHEIRNPIANLRNCLELLHRRLEYDEAGREYASLAIDELLRMHELAERMLHLNRPRDPAVASCFPAEIAQEVAAMCQVGSSPDELRVELDVDRSIEVRVPPDALKQILLNLVQNARDAAPRGLELTIRVHRSRERAEIRVEDNGPGVPPEIRSRVFDPFFTTRASVGGVGLGLFVVEGMVRGFGGTVEIVDSPGGGAAFRISLPAAVAASAADSRATPEVVG